MTSIQIELRHELIERAEELCQYLNIDLESLAEYALEQEITRQEIRRIKDEITIQEINRNILGGGQSLNVLLREEHEALYRHFHTCQMCLREFDRPLVSVEGPLFCDDCLALAKGGDFSVLVKPA
jgi:hypothetical protein